MKKDNIIQAIQALRVQVREIRKQIVEEKPDNPLLSKEDYAEISDFLNFPLHDVEEIRRIAIYRSHQYRMEN